MSDTRKFAFVVYDEMGKLVGFASGGSEETGDPEYDGELYNLHVHPDYHGRGLGHRLVTAVSEELLAKAKQSMLIWVLAANPACGFYEALCGKLVRHREIKLGGSLVPEAGYGWSLCK